jgi:osmotically-inducible protein OsmY
MRGARADSGVRADVENELRLDRTVDASWIGVTVRGGVVTLTGFAGSYIEKVRAEDDAKRVPGAKAIANDITVRWPSDWAATGPAIVRRAVDAIRHEVPYADDLKVSFCDGWLTLHGRVEWLIERRQAEHAVCGLPGVHGITNLVTLHPPEEEPDLRETIVEVLRDHAAIAAESIMVEADHDVVTLRGTVRSWAEKDAVEEVVRHAPGVAGVDDRLVVRS